MDDIGITVDLQPNVDFRDSLDFYIYEGDSPEFIQDAEGGALDIIGGNIESATFQVYNQNGAPKKLTGKIFVQPDLNKVVVTFLVVKFFAFWSELGTMKSVKYQDRWIFSYKPPAPLSIP